MEGGEHLALPQHVLHVPPCSPLLDSQHNRGRPDLTVSVEILPLGGLPGQHLDHGVLHQAVVLFLLVAPDLGRDRLLGGLVQLLRVVDALPEVDVQQLNLGLSHLHLLAHLRL
ncbi:MAG: hypothetical protein ACK55Z_03965, partial [bacterium]